MLGVILKGILLQNCMLVLLYAVCLLTIEATPLILLNTQSDNEVKNSQLLNVFSEENQPNERMNLPLKYDVFETRIKETDNENGNDKNNDELVLFNKMIYPDKLDGDEKEVKISKKSWKIYRHR